ncbi:MAG: glycosyltransferase [Ilumatobacter sp.]|uniref:glycosyltransferase n=3 Tax=Ilumatobacter sp. TaxID=1967498 RepID=UPI0032976415
MEPETQNAPPVVAVVVVHEPGDWFEETLDALADQDYPNLRFLFLLTGPSRSTPSGVLGGSGAGAASDGVDAVETVIERRLPNAFVRDLGANVGFGGAANEVLRLVEGQNGFFLFCHDDIAPDRDAVRLLVEELYRSNAGVVGPKLVQWDDPGVLESVGLSLDRFGEVDQAIEPGEVDQEQHDGVRDVFVIPSAMMLVRADLFRELDGFDAAIELHGEDIEFCWRVHHSGARVVVAPSARARHRSDLVARRPDLNHTRIAARHRLRTVATMTGLARLPGRVLELVVLTVASLVVGLFTGRFRQGVAALRSLLGLIPRLPSIVARRRAVSSIRQVPEREVLGLQQRGSAQLNSFLRSRETTTYVGSTTSVRRWRESTTAPVIAWIVVLSLLLLGSRSALAGGVPPVGEFLRFPDSPRDLLAAYTSGWNPHGLGATEANPTGLAILSVLSFTTLFRMGLLQTVFLIGIVVVGLIGLWKLATVFPSTRARIAALVVYAASPLVGAAYAIGSLDVLVAFAAVPWILHTLRRAVGVEMADPQAARSDMADGLVELSWPERLRRTMQFAIVVALGAAFVPVVVALAVVLGVLLAVGTLLALAPWRTALHYVLVTGAGVLVALLLNIPWVSTWSWDRIVGPSPIGDPGRGLRELASFEIGPIDFASLTLALYLPVVGAILLARAWRLTWAVRSGVIVVGFGFLAVLGDRGALPFSAPQAGVLLVPVAAGLAISAAAALAAFDLDVRGGSFGWRQPLGIASSIAIAVGVFPGVVGITSGDWNAPSTPLSRLIDAQLPDVPADGDGDYHVLLVGDARLLPVPSTEYRDGISFAVIDDDGLELPARWSAPAAGEAAVVDALDQIASGSTQRAGRLLAPLGIRYVIVPEFDDVVSTTDEPLALPTGLVDAIDEQLDIVSSQSIPTVEYFENTSWLPTYSLLSGATAEASLSAGNEALVRADLSSAVAAFSGTDARSSSSAAIPAGTVHVAVPFDPNWRLEVDGTQITPRRAFGVTTAFDVEQAGTATLSYSTPGSRTGALVVQFLLWTLVLFGATRVSIPLARRRGPLVTDETLIMLGEEGPDTVRVSPTFDPGLDMTGQVARLAAVDPDGPPEFAEPESDRHGPTVDGGPDRDPIDELPWVDELIDEVADPIAVDPIAVDRYPVDADRVDADSDGESADPEEESS